MEGILYSAAGLCAVVAALFWYLSSRATRLNEADGVAAPGDKARLPSGLRNPKVLNRWATVLTAIAVVLCVLTQLP